MIAKVPGVLIWGLQKIRDINSSLVIRWTFFYFFYLYFYLIVFFTSVTFYVIEFIIFLIASNFDSKLAKVLYSQVIEEFTHTFFFTVFSFKCLAHLELMLVPGIWNEHNYLFFTLLCHSLNNMYLKVYLLPTDLICCLYHILNFHIKLGLFMCQHQIVLIIEVLEYVMSGRTGSSFLPSPHLVARFFGFVFQDFSSYSFILFLDKRHFKSICKSNIRLFFWLSTAFFLLNGRF